MGLILYRPRLSRVRRIRGIGAVQADYWGILSYRYHLMSTDLLAVAARARIGLLATFFFMGVVSMAWVARIPEIRDANGLNNGQLGLILIASTIGAIIGAQLTGRLVHSYGTKAVIRIAIIIMPIGLILMGFSPHQSL